MDQPTVLRTAKVGGFVKEDVLTYVDELNSKIYALDEELKEARDQMNSGSKDNAQIQKLENEVKQLRIDLGTANAGLRKANEALAQAAKNPGASEDTAKLQAENEQLRKQLASAGSAAENARSEAAAKATKELETARAEIEQLRRANDTLQKENQAKQAEIAALKKSLDEKPAAAPAPAAANGGVDDIVMQQTMAQLTEKSAALKKQSDELAQKEKQIAELDGKVKQLEDQITDLKNNADDAAMPSSFDMGAMFAEAQMVAKKVTIEARNAAERMTKEAKEQAESIVNEANAQAEKKIADTELVIDKTIAEANETAKKTIEDANAKAKTANELSGTVRSTLSGEIDGVARKLTDITEILRQMTEQANSRLDEAQTVIHTARDEIVEVDPKANAFDLPDPAAADQLKAKLNAPPTPEQKAPVQQEKPKQEQPNDNKNKNAKKPANFGFDLDDLAKAVEEAAKNEGDNGSWGTM